MIPWGARRTWITGASSGIGAAMAAALAGPDRALLLSGRSVDRLSAVAEACRDRGSTVETLAFDLSDARDRARAIEAATRSPVDSMINNAGISQRALAADAPIALVERLITVDFLSHVDLTLAVLPGMLERRKGIVVVVSSVAAHAPVPLRSAYNAAKAAQLAWFGTLANEVSRSGVSVTLAIPGFVRTNVSRNAQRADGAPHGQLDPNQRAGVPAERAATEILRAAMRGKRRVYPGLSPGVRAMLALAAVAPGVLDRILAGKDPSAWT